MMNTKKPCRGYNQQHWLIGIHWVMNIRCHASLGLLWSTLFDTYKKVLLAILFLLCSFVGISSLLLGVDGSFHWVSSYISKMICFLFQYGGGVSFQIERTSQGGVLFLTLLLLWQIEWNDFQTCLRFVWRTVVYFSTYHFHLGIWWTNFFSLWAFCFCLCVDIHCLSS